MECETKSSGRTDENGNLAPMHDMSYFDRSVPADVGETYRKSLGKDMFERAKNPLYKNAKGIRFAQETIILSTFSKMKQRDIRKENNDTEVEQD